MIAKYGFIYGTSDHEELLVYVQYLAHPGLYAHDFFVQSLCGSVPNERTAMATLLLPFEPHLAVTVFLGHFLNTVLMILALVRITRSFIPNRYGAWASVFLSYFFFYNRALGDIDFYSAAFQAGDPSAVLAVWALVFFLEQRYMLACVLASIASVIHVLVGFDLMAVLCGVMIWKWLISREVSLRQAASFIGLYICTAGVYLIMVFRAKSAGNGSLPNEELFNIMFLFRHPHHFIFHLFSWSSRILFVIYTSVALVFFSLRSRTVFQFLAVCLIVMIPYIIATDYLHSVLIASFQWYKVAPYMKFFGMMAIAALIFEAMPNILPRNTVWIDRSVLLSGFVAGMLVFMLYFRGDIAHGYKQENAAEVGLSLKLKDMVPLDAVFIQPFEVTGLKFYAQRSSYVDFKAIAKNQKDTREWYRRIQEVYGLDYHTDVSGFHMQDKANEHLDHLDETALAKLRMEGVTHMICHTDQYRAAHHLILSENGYYVYEL